MRVVLVGRAVDRDRLRSQLAEAGIEIASESISQPDADSMPAGVDAIVVAPARNWRPVLEEELTPRELDVLALIAQGLPNKAIAASLGISDQTVKFHVAAIIGKLGALNRTDAVRRAVRRGLVAI